MGLFGLEQPTERLDESRKLWLRRCRSIFYVCMRVADSLLSLRCCDGVFSQNVGVFLFVDGN